MKQLKITRVENGYLLEGEFDKDFKYKVVQIENSSEMSNINGMKKLLIEVMDYYGLYYKSKFAKSIELRIKNPGQE